MAEAILSAIILIVIVGIVCQLAVLSLSRKPEPATHKKLKSRI